MAAIGTVRESHDLDFTLGLEIFEVKLFHLYFSGSNLPVYYINSCDDNGGRSLACKEGEVIHIHDVRCLPYNSTCIGKDRNKLARLCNGLQTCLYMDVRRQLQTNCKEYNGQVITSFQCISGKSKFESEIRLIFSFQ